MMHLGRSVGVSALVHERGRARGLAGRSPDGLAPAARLEPLFRNRSDSLVLSAASTSVELSRWMSAAGPLAVGRAGKLVLIPGLE